ncbi:recombinase family protein [Clostridium perfringens]|uniref:recombinase family protein n=1 Tax=Clostridium perfringens TaxID=1502 RepID=UPI001CACF878|nr:recombinase family protein [Clostridium perfringens]MDK0934427.1 recombinase family protein [Clostridium perfringens]MDM0987630.1 recombinase family protein [Clostridium perfringens]HBI7094832.1 recombinase family protein [Clostridium perfringens]
MTNTAKITKTNKGIKEREILKEHHNRQEPITWGYMRVSTTDQKLIRQEEALLNYGVSPDFIISDKATGKNTEREGYQKLKKCLKAGDTLVILELDRLSRNMQDLKTEWNDLKNKGVGIVVINQPVLNTAGKTGAESQLISDIMFSLLGYMAQTEREKNQARAKKGLEQAKQRGVKIGRPKKQEELNRAVEMYLKNSFTVAEIIKLCGISRATFYKELKERGIKN